MEFVFCCKSTIIGSEENKRKFIFSHANWKMENVVNEHEQGKLTHILHEFNKFSDKYMLLCVKMSEMVFVLNNNE